MLAEVLSWWLQRMAECLPVHWVARRPDHRDTLIIAPVTGPNGGLLLHLWHRHRRRLTDLGRHDPALPGAAQRLQTSARTRPGAEAVLRLDQAMLLERDVDLPLAAAPDLPRVLGYEMDRLTPFRAEDVVWDFAPIARDRAQGRISLRLSLVPRASIGAALTAIDRLGLVVSALQIGDTDPPRLIRMRSTPSAAQRMQRRLTVGAMATCAVLLAAVIISPFISQALDRAAVDARIEALRPQIAQAEALRRRIAQAKANGDVIAEQRSRSGDALAVLAALTEILPDDTVLSELTLSQRTLSLRGQSTAAARLIGLLAADGAIRNPIFTAPVTRSEGTRPDQFALQAEVAP